MAIRGQWGLGRDHPCGYLPEQRARMELLFIEEIGEPELEALLDQGYRHFGTQFFRPLCRGCQACIPIRVPTAGYRLRRSGRRALARAAHLNATVGPSLPTAEAHALYCRHKERFRDTNPDAEPTGYDEFAEAFFHPFPFAYTLTLRDGPRLVAVSHFDLTRGALSAVYCYWAPEDAECSPGRVAVLRLIALAAERGIPYVHLGFYIAANAHMVYKADFFPNEVLLEPGNWVPFVDGAGERLLSAAALEGGFCSPGRPYLPAG